MFTVGDTSASTTRAPLAWSATAIAYPSPRAAPVTRAIFSVVMITGLHSHSTLPESGKKNALRSFILQLDLGIKELVHVFQNLLDPAEEQRGRSSIDPAMIEGEIEREHRAYYYLVLDHDSALLHICYAHNTHLWRIQNGRETSHRQAHQVGERKSTAGKIIRPQPVSGSSLFHDPYGLMYLRQRERLHSANDWNDQALRRVRCNAQVNVRCQVQAIFA